MCVALVFKFRVGYPHVFTPWQYVHICALLDYESLTHWPNEKEEFSVFTVYISNVPIRIYLMLHVRIHTGRINSHGVNLFFSHPNHCLWAYKPLKLVTLEILVGWEGRNCFFFFALFSYSYGSVCFFWRKYRECSLFSPEKLELSSSSSRRSRSVHSFFFFWIFLFLLSCLLINYSRCVFSFLFSFFFC